ncbi:MAG: hypothetical protein GKR96_08300 [Gammaproteobacteria bacterium]|nr:hypothetical protein [Gammaproteobacteria bacterium]
MAANPFTNFKWSADFVGNPVVWLATTVVVVVLASILIPGPNDSPSTEVVKRIVPTEFESNIKNIDDIVKEENMLITREDDTERFEEFLQVEKTDNLIRPLFEKVRAYIDEDRLIGTDDNNAWTVYGEILALDPENAEAKSGLSKLLNYFIDNAEMAIESSQYEEAQKWLVKLDIAQPGNDLQVSLREEINAEILRRAEEQKRKQEALERKQQIAALLTRAREEAQIFTFDFDMVRDIYLDILEIDADNEEGKQGLISLANRQLDNAEILIRANVLDRAEQLIIGAQENDPENQRLSGISLALEVRVKQYEQEKAQEQLAQQQGDNTGNTQTSIVLTQQPLPETQPAPNEANSQASNAVNDEPEESKTTKDNRLVLSGVNAYYQADYPRAFELLFPVAERGRPRAQFRIGMMYESGRSVSVDKEAADKWFSLALPSVISAAQNGVAWAQADLGTAYEFGISLQQDYERAAHWYNLSAKQGYAGAQTNLGVLYANGEGVPLDNDKAIYWLTLAADQGDTIAAENLSIIKSRSPSTANPVANFFKGTTSQSARPAQTPATDK